MFPLRKRRRQPARASSVLLVALGAITGLAVGAVLADRAGGLDGLLRKGTGRRNKRVSGELDQDEMALAAAADNADVDQDYAEAPDGDDGEFDDDEEFADDSGSPGAAGIQRGSRAAGEAPDEAELEERVLEAFHNDPVLAERAIDIGAIGTGVIELTGWVQSSWEIGHAITLAKGVPDVVSVVDRLAVRDGQGSRDHSGRHYAGDADADTAPADGALPRAD